MPALAQFSTPQIDLLPEDGPATDDIRTQVWGLLSTLYPKVSGVERRREARYPFPFLVHLTPAEGDVLAENERIVAVGKHISAKGLGFYHPKPIVHRRMVVSLEGANGNWYAFTIDLKWCRFTKHGWYESGGRFLEVVTSPLSE